MARRRKRRMKRFIKSKPFDGDFYDSLRAGKASKDIKKATKEVSTWPKWLRENAEVILPSILKEKVDEPQ